MGLERAEKISLLHLHLVKSGPNISLCHVCPINLARGTVGAATEDLPARPLGRSTMGVAAGSAVPRAWLPGALAACAAVWGTGNRREGREPGRRGAGCRCHRGAREHDRHGAAAAGKAQAWPLGCLLPLPQGRRRARLPWRGQLRAGRRPRLACGGQCSARLEAGTPARPPASAGRRRGRGHRRTCGRRGSAHGGAAARPPLFRCLA